MTVARTIRRGDSPDSATLISRAMKSRTRVVQEEPCRRRNHSSKTFGRPCTQARIARNVKSCRVASRGGKGSRRSVVRSDDWRESRRAIGSRRNHGHTSPTRIGRPSPGSAARRRAESHRARIETFRLKQEACQRFARDLAVLREKRRRAERAKLKTIPPRVTRRYGHRHRSVWVPTPILERPWLKLIARMVPGKWYSRPALRALAPDVPMSWAYGAGRPYLDRGRKTTPDMKHPPGFLSLFRLNGKGEALRAAFLAAKPEGA